MSNKVGVYRYADSQEFEPAIEINHTQITAATLTLELQPI